MAFPNSNICYYMCAENINLTFLLIFVDTFLPLMSYHLNMMLTLYLWGPIWWHLLHSTTEKKQIQKQGLINYRHYFQYAYDIYILSTVKVKLKPKFVGMLEYPSLSSAFGPNFIGSYSIPTCLHAGSQSFSLLFFFPPTFLKRYKVRRTLLKLHHNG